MPYRIDIQILRGIAVLFVVLFHLNLSYAPLGFLGVDVFFVISGFLMAILIRQRTISDFLLRRVKRLLPAYLGVVFIVLIVAFFLTLPFEYDLILQEIIYALLFVSNIGFWAQNTYFTQAEFWPLLHFWSLAVEVQFYVIVPFLYYLEKKILKYLFYIFLVSIASCFFIVSLSPNAAFFWMPFRIWQFLLGWGAALYILNFSGGKNNVYNQLSTMISLVVLCVIMCLPLPIENQKSIIAGHPGIISLIICLLTAHILIFRLPDRVNVSFVGRFFEYIGNYSYVIYLVHLPVIVFYNYQPFSGNILSVDHYLDYVPLAIVIIAFSFLVYVIEKKSYHYFIFKRVFILIALLLGCSFVLQNTHTYYLDQKSKKILYAAQDTGIFRCGTLFRVKHMFKEFCPVPHKSEHILNKNIMLIGNSHAAMIKDSFANIAAQYGYQTFLPVSNGPLMDSDLDHNWLINHALRLKAEAIFIHYSPFIDLKDIVNNLEEKLKKHNIRMVYLTSVPTYNTDIPEILYMQQEKEHLQTVQQYHHLNKDNFSFLQDRKYYDLGKEVFCKPNCLFINKNGYPLYFDEQHLTVSGARLLEPLFHKIFSEI